MSPSRLKGQLAVTPQFRDALDNLLDVPLWGLDVPFSGEVSPDPDRLMGELVHRIWSPPAGHLLSVLIDQLREQCRNRRLNLEPTLRQPMHLLRERFGHEFWDQLQQELHEP